MTVETVTYIDDFNASYPDGGDSKSEGDNHIRNLKTGIKNTFQNINGAVTTTQDELNILDGATVTTAELNILDGVTATAAELNYADGPNAASKFCLLDGSAKVPFAQRSAFRGALVGKTSGQSVSTSNVTALTFDSEDYDTDTIHDNATNNTRLTVPTGVTKVRLSGQTVTSGISTGQFDVFIYKNGAAFTPGSATSRLRHSGTSTNPAQNVTSSIISVASGDYFELMVAQYTGGAVTYGSTTWFSMEIIE